MELIILLLIAYLIGSIPSALWVGKLFYKTDIREHGSGNLGGTNTFRVLGKTAGLTVTILDILKGTIAALLPLLPIFDSVTVHPLIPGILAVVEHMYPVFAHGPLSQLHGSAKLGLYIDKLKKEYVNGTYHTFTTCLFNWLNPFCTLGWETFLQDGHPTTW